MFLLRLTRVAGVRESDAGVFLAAGEIRLDVLRKVDAGHIQLYGALVLVPRQTLDERRLLLPLDPQDLLLDMASDHVRRQRRRQVLQEQTPRPALGHDLVLRAQRDAVVGAAVREHFGGGGFVACDAEAVGLDRAVEGARGSRLDEGDQRLGVLVRARIVEEDAVDAAGADCAAETAEVESARETLEVDAVEVGAAGGRVGRGFLARRVSSPSFRDAI